MCTGTFIGRVRVAATTVTDLCDLVTDCKRRRVLDKRLSTDPVSALTGASPHLQVEWNNAQKLGSLLHRESTLCSIVSLFFRSLRHEGGRGSLRHLAHVI